MGGGLFRAVERGEEDGARTIQLFCKNPRQWKTRPLSSEEINAFTRARATSEVETWAQWKEQIGWAPLKAIHLNDSKTALGSRVDRHAQIGEGHLGLPFFERLLHDPHLAEIPAYLETPPLPDGKPSFARNLAQLRQMIHDPLLSR
jgi:endonuclease IV